MSLISLLPLLHLWYRMMKLPSFSKYRTSRISSLYVFPLIWLRELFFQPHFAQGYCEGVVGRFSGLDVKFLSRLKKPVMTKRASLGASSFLVSMQKVPDAIQHDGYRTSQPHPLPAVPTAPREPRTEAIVIVIHAQETWVQTASTVFSSTRS